MYASAWSNGSPNKTTGSGYGLRISTKDVDKFEEWDVIVLKISGQKDPFEVKKTPFI